MTPTLLLLWYINDEIGVGEYKVKNIPFNAVHIDIQRRWHCSVLIDEKLFVVTFQIFMKTESVSSVTELIYEFGSMEAGMKVVHWMIFLRFRLVNFIASGNASTFIYSSFVVIL